MYQKLFTLRTHSRTQYGDKTKSPPTENEFKIVTLPDWSTSPRRFMLANIVTVWYLSMVFTVRKHSENKNKVQ